MTVTATEFLTKNWLIHHNAAIGLIFPFLFSIAVLLINQYANNIHLDTDAILLGELAFASIKSLTSQHSILIMQHALAIMQFFLITYSW